MVPLILVVMLVGIIVLMTAVVAAAVVIVAVVIVVVMMVARHVGWRDFGHLSMNARLRQLLHCQFSRLGFSKFDEAVAPTSACGLFEYSLCRCDLAKVSAHYKQVLVLGASMQASDIKIGFAKNINRI